MKWFLPFILLVNSVSLSAELFNRQDWLLWESKEAALPYFSAMTAYPPVTLISEGDTLRGFVSIPYSFDSDNDQLMSEFLIVVIDQSGKSHFLKPEIENIGFVGDVGIATSRIESKAFTEGTVTIQLYKANNEKNRLAMEKSKRESKEYEEGVSNALQSLNVPKPMVNESWDFNPGTNWGLDLDEIVASAERTIIQLYGPGCGFCRQAIPYLNQLNTDKKLNVIGISGMTTEDAFQQHIIANNIQYPFINYVGEYSLSALTEALGLELFPTYFVLDKQKTVTGIFVGSFALEEWLATIKG